MDYKLKESVDDLMVTLQKNQENSGADDNLTENLKTLQAALEAVEPVDVTYGAALKIDNLMKEVDEKGLLSVAALKLMDKKSMFLTAEENGKFYRCIYLACRSTIENRDQALAMICGEINELVKDGLVHSTLAPPSSIDFARQPGESPSCAVFCYVLVPGDDAESIEKRMKWIAHEGGTGKELGSIKMILPEGEFFAVARVYHQFNMLVSSGSNYDIPGHLFETVQEYLRVLPIGTKFLGATKCAITDLSVPYELRFSNPLLQRVKMVQLESVRDFARLDDKIKEFNLLTGVTYFDADGNKLHGPLTF
jgi:hypothetical protein